ncbi:MAG: hypothetical protein WBD20_01725 [Pirellulaceae bacterium]
MNRFLVTLVLCGCLVPVASQQEVHADEPSEKQPLTWTNPFEPISAAESRDKLVLLLITNDVAFATDDTDAPRQLWCTPIVESVVRSAMKSRSDLKDKLVLQPVAAGTPKLLSNGVDRNQPQRAIVVLCDVNYKLLSLQVGVPDDRNLLTMIEDGQYVQTLLQLHPGTDDENSNKRFDEIVQYTSERMPRLWREALKAITNTMRQDAEDDATTIDVENTDTLSGVLDRRWLARIGQSYEGIYLTDVKQRFAVNESSDLLRLAVIEQHPQARQPWCDAMLPFLAGLDTRTHWRAIAELVWKRPTVVDPNIVQDNDDDQLLAWWELQKESKMVIFGIKPLLLESLRPWPPVNVDNAADKRGLGWKDLENAATKHPFRYVTHQQLATLMRSRELKQIEVLFPTPARYVLFDPNRQMGVTIHESDLPAKYIGRIKRNIK